MNIENTQSQMRKGILEFCILSIIRRGEAYPSDIVEEMRAANLQILEGTLYPLLTRLKNAEMLSEIAKMKLASGKRIMQKRGQV